MRPIVIASDIHGSSFYCRKLIDAIHREDARRVFLLGDILYHGPRNELPRDYNPKAVIAMLNGLVTPVYGVRGNCDAEVDQMVLNFPIMSESCWIDCGWRMIFATHGHIYNENHLPPLSPGDILLHGHTHVPVWKLLGDDSYYGGADVFLDRPHFVGNKPKLILYCIGLMPPKDILIRSSLYQ